MNNFAEKIQEESKGGEIVNFPNLKLKKDGTPKGTRSNAKKNRDNVYPFKEEDLPKLIEYFKNRITESKNDEDKAVAIRDLALVRMGFNIGLRVSDLVSLKWNQVYDENWKFRVSQKLTPQKTSKKNKKVVLIYNESFRRAVDEFRAFRKPKELDEYIFECRQSDHLGTRRAGQIVKDAAKANGLEYNVCSHSLRKTFARLRYDHAADKTKVLIELMKIFNHSNPQVTLDYICIGIEELEDLYNNVNVGFYE